MDYLFNNSFGTKLSVRDVISEIVRFIEEQPNYSYKIVIGTDSEQLRDNMADFVTAIVIHRVGNGGRYFWRRVDGKRFYTMRDRIIHEVILSLEVAKVLLEKLSNIELGVEWGFEIHADIGENGPTHELIQEVVGMIRANNFEVRTKPDSYAATKVADRHV